MYRKTEKKLTEKESSDSAQRVSLCVEYCEQEGLLNAILRLVYRRPTGKGM